MRRYAIGLFTMICCFTVLVTSVSASGDIQTSQASITSSTRIELPDGGYVIEEIITMPSTARTTSTSGTKTSTRYTASGHAVFAIKVTGSFKYTGSSSWATSSAASVLIYDSDATYVSKSSSYSGNTAYATGTVKYLGLSETKTVSLTCDKNGNLS